MAAVYSEDDYGSPRMDSHWARLGDKITLHNCIYTQGAE